MDHLLIFDSADQIAVETLLRNRGISEVSAINIGNDFELDEISVDINIIQRYNVLSKEELDEIAIESSSISESWYKVGHADCSIVNDMSFGRYVEYELKSRLLQILVIYAVLLKIRPKNLLLFNNDAVLLAALKVYSDTLGISLDHQNLRVVAPPSGLSWRALALSVINRVYQSTCACVSILKEILYPPTPSLPVIFVQKHRYSEGLIKYLLESGEYRVLSDQFSWKFLPYKNFSPLLHKFIAGTVTRDKLIQLDYKIHPDKIKSEYRGLPLKSVIYKIFKNLLELKIREFVIFTEIATDLFSINNLRAVFLMQDQALLPKVLSVIAKSHKVRTVLISHGIDGFLSAGYLNYNVDVVTHLGLPCKNLAEKYIPDIGNSIRLPVGNDSFTAISPARRDKSCHQVTRKYRWIKPGSKILFVSDPYVNVFSAEEPFDQAIILGDFCRAIERLYTSNIRPQVIVRLHPSSRYYERADAKAKIVKRTCADIRIDAALSLEEVLSVCDIVVAGYSTVGLQALLYGRPLVIYDPFRRDPVGYIAQKAGAVAFDIDQLVRVISKLQCNSEFYRETVTLGEQFIRNRVYGYGDKLASKRLFQLIP